MKFSQSLNILHNKGIPQLQGIWPTHLGYLDIGKGNAAVCCVFSHAVDTFNLRVE